MAQHGWQKGFIKPLVGANARECLRFENTPSDIAQAQAHVDRLTPNEDLVLQPYLDNVESFGETSGIFFAGQYSHGTRKIPVQGDFRVQDDYGASDYPYQLTDDELELAKKAINYVSRRFSQPLYARIDFLHHKHGAVFVNEVELIEPSLFFRHGGTSACKLFAETLANHITHTH
jgi:glutathione synthase/RimK-type ligase-like ATP-grasp enzyme